MTPADSVLVAALAPFPGFVKPASTTITYAFADAGFALDEGPSLAWTETQKDYVRDAYAYLSTLLDLTFEESGTSDTATMVFAHIEDLGTSAGYQIGDTSGRSLLAIATEYLEPIARGTDNTTVLHEIGHALGLSHPHDGPTILPGVDDQNDPGDFTLNTELSTRMSYVPGALDGAPGLQISGEALTLGALDIAALHLMYVANTTTGLGDTVYGISSDVVTIWDNGGFDIIDFSGAVDDTVIDLRAASLEVESEGGGFFSYIKRDGGTRAEGGYTIAFGVEVEDARGGSASDAIIGNDLQNFLYGEDGDDGFLGAGGDDRLDGGTGLDTALYSKADTHYTLTLSAAGTTLQDRTGVDGTDTLIDIEALVFGDSTEAPFDLSKFGGTQNLTAGQMESFVELYIAYFNRAPDAVGLNFWGTSFSTGTTFEEMAFLFTDQDETRETYAADLSNADFATAVYANVLGRQADQAGFDFWVGVLDSGARTRDQFILSVLEGAKTPIVDGSDETRAQQIADQQYLSIKTDIGAYFAVNRGLSDLEEARAAMAIFDGSAGSVTAARDAIDGYYADAIAADGGQFILQLVGVIDDPFV